MNNRVPNGKRRRSTDTTSLEEGRPDAVTPGPVWQVTSKTPSGVPELFAELGVGAAEVVGVGDMAAASAAVEAGGAAGVPVLWQPLSSTAPANATVGRTRGVQRVTPRPARRSIRSGTPGMVPPTQHLKPAFLGVSRRCTQSGSPVRAPSDIFAAMNVWKLLRATAGATATTWRRAGITTQAQIL